MSEWVIPKGWKIKKLEDQIELIMGQAPVGDSYNTAGVGTVLVKVGEFGKTFPEKKVWTTKPTKFAKTGDVLLCVVGATIGKINLGIDCCIGRSVAALRPNESKLMQKFLYYFLKKEVMRIREKQQGSAQGVISKPDINNLEIFLPPLETQKNIVAKLDHILGKLEEKKKEIFSRIEKFDAKMVNENYKNYLLKLALDGVLTKQWRLKHRNESSLNFLKKINEKKEKNKFLIIAENEKINSWTDVKLENLVYIAGRIGWKGLKQEEYTKTGPLFLSVHSLNYGDIVDYRNAFHIPQWRYDESPEIQLVEEDILLAKDGNIGKIGIVKNLKEPTTINSSLLLIRSGEAFIPKFLFYFLSGPKMQKIARERTLRNTVPHLFQKDIKNFILSVPPLNEQIEIVKKLDQKFADWETHKQELENIQKRHETMKLHLNNLSSTILNDAFSGKLVN